MTQTTERDAAEARYRELAAERHGLGERTEEEIAALAKTLREIEGLDARQRKEARAAGADGIIDKTPPGVFIGHWLSNRLGGVGGYAGLVRHLDAEKTLPELDPLAAKQATERTNA